MNLYNFYIAKYNLPFETLTYSSEIPLKKGQLCSVLIKNNEYLAICASESNLDSSQIKNLREIDKVYGFILTNEQFEFYFKVGFLTFNSFNNLLTLGIKPFNSLMDSKKNPIYQVNLNSTNTLNDGMDPNINYNITIDWTKEILTIIMKNQYNNILVITPEKKMAKPIIDRIENFLIESTTDNKYIISDLTTTGNKQSKAYQNIYNQDQKTVNFSNKNELFTTLNPYDHIIIIDEANPSYISESRIYFDTREVAYWASKIYNIDVTFISTLPSVRFSSLASSKLDILCVPQITLKFLERTSKQKDFSNILNELEDDTRIFGEEME